ncbi:hypothetical protein [Limimaricola soesokkakensis]|uniref:hypothetical protein n=1 Tax=Limimaricola soesokkakensis TaxID=1343159 RepID=UPI0035165EA7
MNLRRIVAEIQVKIGGLPMTEAEREDIAQKLKVSVTSIMRIEARIFANDVALGHTDVVSKGDVQTVTFAGIIAVKGGRAVAEVEMDWRQMMARIHAICAAAMNGSSSTMIARGRSNRRGPT